MFGVAVALLPVAEQRPVQLQVTPWPEAGAAFELETSWQHFESLYGTWMNSENSGLLQRKCSILEAVAFLILIVLKFAEAFRFFFFLAEVDSLAC